MSARLVVEKKQKTIDYDDYVVQLELSLEEATFLYTVLHSSVSGSSSETVRKHSDKICGYLQGINIKLPEKYNDMFNSHYIQCSTFSNKILEECVKEFKERLGN